MSPAQRDDPRPLPDPAGLHADWYAHLARGELRFQRCGACTRWRHPPRHLCPECGSGEWVWAVSARRGTLFSWTVTHQPLHPAFADAVPYVIAVAELEEGVRVVAGVPSIDRAALRLGLPIVVEVEPAGERLGLLSIVARP